MTESVLIQISDVQIYRRIDTNFDSNRFAALANEVQRVNLRDLLGQNMYYDFFDNITAAKYVSLRDGGSYTFNGSTIQYFGLKPALSYWWLAKAVMGGDLFISDYGAIEFSNNQQQSHESYRMKQQAIMDLNGKAQTYANDIIRYIIEHSSNYPLYEGEGQKGVTQFTTFRV